MDGRDDHENLEEESTEMDDLASPIRFDFTGSCSSSSSYGSLDSNMKTSVAIQIPTSPFSPLSQSMAAPTLTHCSMASSSTPSTSDEDENDIFPWLQALELHAIGACRTDERLRPVLRWNVSCFGANGRLGLHFKAKELAMLARCLCTPLVSIRVGKIFSQGRVLYPSSTRGHLSLTMLPNSSLRLSFREDSGSLERLAQMTPCTEKPPVILEQLPADKTSRSFVLKLQESRLAFFWQSEKIKATGDELVLKMKDFLLRRPTLSQLTGIPESRLETLASYINSSLASSSEGSSSSSSSGLSSSLSSPCLSTSVSTRTSESAIVPPTMPSSSSSSLSPLLSDLNPITPQINMVTSLPISVTSCDPTSTSGIISNLFNGDDNHRNLFMEVDRDAFAQRLLGSLPRSLVPFPLLRVSGSTAGTISPRLPTSSGSILTPCYCPCPLGNVSALQCTFAPPFLPSLPSDHHLPSSAPPSSLVADLFSSLPFPLLPQNSTSSSSSANEFIRLPNFAEFPGHNMLEAGTTRNFQTDSGNSETDTIDEFNVDNQDQSSS